MEVNKRTNRRSVGIAAFCLMVALLGCGGGEARKAHHVERGEQFMAERNYPKALLEFRNALQIDPKDARVREMTGLAAEKSGDFNEAIKLYRGALAADDSLVVARAHLARFTALAGEPDDAMQLLGPGFEQHPQSADLLSARAIVRAEQGDADAARNDAQAAVALDPTNADALGTLASLLWREGQRDASIATLNKAVSTIPDALELRLLLAQLLLVTGRTADAELQLGEIARRDPGKYENDARLIQVYLVQGKADEAIEAARAAVKTYPDSNDAKLALVQLLAMHRSWGQAEEALSGFRAESARDLDLMIDIGRFYEANGRHAEAEDAFAKVLESDATKAQALAARSQLARLKLRSGETDLASRLVDEILEESPTDAVALVTRAELALLRDDTSGAIVSLRAALGNDPDSVPLAAALARAHLQAGQAELAEQVLRGVVQLDPRTVEGRLALARFLVDRGRVDDARSVVEQLVLEQPGNLAALAVLAQLQFAGRDPAAALRSAATIQALQPASASGYLLAGQIQEAERKVEAAREAYELAAEMDPTSLEPLIALARLNVQHGEAQRTLPLLDQRIEAMPSNALLHVLRGEVLLAMREPARAAESFGRAVEKQRTLVSAYRGLARAQFQGGDADAAVATLRQGLDATGGASRIALELGALLAGRGRTADAIAVYEDALVRNPADNPAANDLAMLLVRNEPDAKALKRAGDLVERFADSTNPAFLDTRGWVLYKQGRFEEAVAVLEKAVAGAPSARELRYHLGMAQLKAGRTEDARESLEAAVSEGPAYDGIETARETLGRL